jgi:hypothetical protein
MKWDVELETNSERQIEKLFEVIKEFNGTALPRSETGIKVPTKRKKRQEAEIQEPQQLPQPNGN